jgi:hypothetical protein
MNNMEYLYRVLHSALIIMRAEGLEIGNKKIYHLCNLLHNVPLQLLSAESEDDHSKLLFELKTRSEELGLGKWLEAEISESQTGYLAIEDCEGKNTG